MENQPTNISTDVAIRIIETKPAVVNFNYQEISDHLDGVLEKYRGLVFGDKDIAECKKTIAELRKGQKALDEFRKTTKKKLTESVTNFEFQCKTLFNKFEAVIKPLTEQQDQFELERKEKKRVEIQSIINFLVTEKALNEKYAPQLIITEEYFNKGKTIKAIKSELSAFANTLKVQQDKEAQDIDLIKTKVELANAQYQLTNALMPEQYLRHLAYHSVANIEDMITSDAQQISDREKKAAEDLTVKVEKVPKVEEAMEPELANDFVTTPATFVAPKTDQTITAVYEVTGTEEQMSALETYLDENNFDWRAKDKAAVEDFDSDDFMY